MSDTAPDEALDVFGPATRAWFVNGLGAPTEVQARGWPRIAQGAHTLMVAPTGSGKTLAAFLYALDRLMARPEDTAPGIRVLYVSPLKALAYDIERNLRAPLVGIGHAAKRLGTVPRPVRVDLRTGDTPQKERARQKRNPGEILVTTPESLYLILTSQAREVLRTVETVIVDEIHVMAGTKRGVHLALTLERLSQVADQDPQRIGLSATQRPLDVAARFLGGDRPVAIVDTSAPPRLDLEIVVPVEDMENPPAPEPDPFDAVDDPMALDEDALPGLLPVGTGSETPLQSGIWPSIHPRLLDLIRSHRSTILFTNSRLLCERLTQALNDLAGEPLVRAHHGSISHEQRGQIEEDLKQGRIPGIVATSSLELGIDMGAVDLVILVASPGSASRGLQRIGRAGHQVGAVSQGRIFPKFRGDLLEATVVADQMTRGEIEATATPRNCLDVLAQQVVAIVAEKDWPVDDLLAVVKRAAPYAELSHDAWVAVLDMLSGRYPSDGFAELTPRLVWDRTTDVLSARRGAKMVAVLNGGTIPDRGLYRVQLGEGGPRLGELDEEMVFESREGDVIILGASSWRIQEITRDKVLVSPAPGQPGRLPFWRGERPGRPLELGRALGAFLREMGALEETEATDLLVERQDLDPLAARNLVAYVHEQRDATGALPTDEAITVERFRDELGDWRIVILTPFGSRIHAPWALALEAMMASRAGFDVGAFHSDDGIALRFADGEEIPEADDLFPDPEEVEDLIVDQLRHSAVFAARFRENAGRALLLPKRRPGRRTPLWLQRKKSADLLAVAHQHPSFPIILETYRECLQDVFDVPALQELLTRIRSRAVRVDEVETNQASPFSRSLVFQYVAAYLYDGDAPLAERKAAALSLDRHLLRELLGQEQLRDLLDGDVVDAVEAELQCLVAARHARHLDAVHDLLRRLGDLSGDEVAIRTEGDPAPWLEELAAARRILAVRVAGEERWIAVEDAARYRDALGVALPRGVPSAFLEPEDDPLGSVLRRWARTHGPFRTAEVASRLGLPTGAIDGVLRPLEQDGHLVHGELRPGGTAREWCDAEVLRRIRRRTLAHLRQEVEPVAPEVLARFLPAWQGLDRRRGGLERLREVLQQIEGIPLPFSVLEGEILPARVPDYQPMFLDQLGAMGELVWVGRGALGRKDGRVALHHRVRVPLLVDPEADDRPSGVLHDAITGHLEGRGASFLVELVGACDGATSKDVLEALWDLVWAGRVTNDTFQPLRALSAPKRGGRRRGVPMAGGRWSLVSQLVGEAPNPTERRHAQAATLLERHGVVCRDTLSAESVPGGFSALYPVFSAMEEAGKVRRGWFVDGLGGAQFAVPGAVDRLRRHRTAGEDEVRILGVTDPAQPWGSTLPWPDPWDVDKRPRRVAGARVLTVGGRPVLYLGKGDRTGISFRRVAEEEDTLERAIRALTDTLDYRTLRLETLDGRPALEHPLTERLVAAGFRRDRTALLLIRHAGPGS